MTCNPLSAHPCLMELEPKFAPGDFLLGALLSVPLVAESPAVARPARVKTVAAEASRESVPAVMAPITTPTSDALREQSSTRLLVSHTNDQPGRLLGVGVNTLAPRASTAHAMPASVPQSLLGVTGQSTGPLRVGRLPLKGAAPTVLSTITAATPSMAATDNDSDVRAVTGSDSGNSIALDRGGNSVITGSYWNGTDTDVFVSKVTPSGTVLFTNVLKNAGPDSGNAIAIDSRGNIFVAGSRTSLGGDVDAFVAKFGRNGAFMQMTTIVNPGPDSGNGLAVGAGNNGYVTGSLWNGVDSDFFISRFTATTSISCSFIYPNPGTDGGNAVGLDSDSNAYVTGTFSFFADNYLYLAKFDTACGLLNGTYILNTGQNAGNGIAVTASGEGFVTGTYWNGVDSDFIIARFDAAGAFPNSFVYTNPGDDRGNAVVFDAAFNAYVTGAFTFGSDVYVYVAMFTPECQLLNGGYIFHVGEDRGMDIVLGSGGTSFVTGAFDNGSHTDAFVAEFDAALMLVDQTFIPNTN